VTVFGPQTLTRTTGSPNVFTFSFISPAVSPYLLHIDNHGVTSAVVTLNGVEILGPSDFQHDEAILERSVILRPASNSLRVELRSKPGTYLSIRISGTDTTPPIVSAAASPAANGAGWNRTDVQVTFTCSDSGAGVASCPASRLVNTEAQGLVVAGTATDKAGNSATASVTLNIDKTAPTIAGSVAPAPNAAGWVNQDVAVAFSCADDRSGVASCSPPATVSGGGSQIVPGTVIDRAGNTAATSLTVNLDKAPPTITAALSPAPNAAGWNSADVTVTFTCDDDTSGIAVCPAPVIVSTEGANQTITGTAHDRAGNDASTSVTLRIDRTPSTITASATPAANADGWHNAPVVVSFACSDAGAGVLSCPEPVTVAGDGGQQTISRTVTDTAGNPATASVTVNIDTARPTIIATTLPPANAQGWNDANVTVTFTCADTLSGIAVCPAQVQVPTEGPNQVIAGTAIDKAGNSATASVTLNIDKTSVSITAAVQPAPNPAGWNNTDLVVTFQCQDAGAGVGACPPPVTVTTEGANQVISRTVTDLAGNPSTASVSVSIDKTVPQITYAVAPSANAAGWMRQDATITFACVDPGGSGVGSCSPPTTFGEGAGQAVIGTTTDIAGNSATATATVSVDHTPPSITAAVAPAPNAAGWNRTPVVVTFTCTDSVSAIDSCPVPSTVTAEGAGQAISGTAIDKAGNPATASVTLNVDQTAPVVTIASPLPGALLTITPATISGSASDALSGIAAATCNGAPLPVASGGVLTCSPVLIDGENTLILGSTDMAGNTTTSQVIVSYTSNRAPVANAGGDYSGTSGVPVAFNAAGSSDADNDPLTYTWSFGDGASGSGVNASHIYATAGTFDVKLTVADPKGATHTATTRATIGQANRTPTARAGAPVTGEAAVAVPFDGGGSTDPDNDVLSYAWAFGDGQTGTGRAAAHVYASAGSFIVTLTVTDTHGLSDVATTSATIAAAADRAPPVVTVTGQKEALPGTQVTMIADATDNVGVTSVTFDINGADPIQLSAPPYERLVTVPDFASAGTSLRVGATAVDAAGNRATASATLTIVAEPDTVKPIVTVKVPSQAAPGSVLQVGATASDNAGIASVVLAANGTVFATLTAPPYEATYTVPPGTAVGSSLSFSAQAIDAADNRAIDTAAVPIVPAPDTIAPTVAITAPAQATAGTAITITATAADEIGVASVRFFLDGARIATVFDPPYTTIVSLPSTLPAGTRLHIEARATDFSGLQGAASQDVDVVAAGAGVITGEVYDDRTSLPIEGASVALVGTDARGVPYTQTAESDLRGRYLIHASEGAGIAQISKPGWSVANRAIAVKPNMAVTIVDARLTPAGAGTPIAALSGGTVTGDNRTFLRVWQREVSAAEDPALAQAPAAGDDIRLNIPAGALAANQMLTLTPLSRQSLPGLLPAGWTPLAIVDVGPPGLALATGAALTSPNPLNVKAETQIVFAQWDEQPRAWRAIASNALAVDKGGLAGAIQVTGQYAWVAADVIPAAPPLPADGELLGGVATALIPADAAAVVNPQPKILFYKPGVTSDVRGMVTTPGAPLSSGTIVRSRIIEAYQFTSQAELHLEAVEQDLVLYQIPGGPVPVMAAGFVVSSSVFFEALSLATGVITVELRAPLDAVHEVALIGSTGGSALAATGERLDVQAGSTPLAVPIEIRPIPASQIGADLPPGFELVGAAEIAFAHPLTAPAAFSIPRPPQAAASDLFLLARLQELAGETRFVLIGTGAIVNDRLVSNIALAGTDILFEGVRTPGRYVFLRAATPLAFAAGTVTGQAGAMFAGALVSSASVGLVSVSQADGRYIAAIALGEVLVTALDVQKTDTVSAQVTSSAPRQVVTLDLALAPRPPTITSVTPSNGAGNVALGAPVIIHFSSPIDPATATLQSVQLTSPSGIVIGTLALTANNTVATFRAVEALQPNAAYTVNVAESVKDRFGRSLPAPFASTFTSLNTTAPPPPPAGSILASIPIADGKTTITATQGTAGAHDTVAVKNVTNGTFTPVVVGANGGFIVRVAAGLRDKLQIVITGANGRQTIVDVGRFENADGSVVIGPEGGQIAMSNGVTLNVPAGAFPDGSIVKVTPLAESDLGVLAANRPGPEEYAFVNGFELNSSAEPQVYLNATMAAPAGAATDPNEIAGVVAQVVTVLVDQAALSTVDTLKVIDGQLTTSSPPCPGILDKYARYAMYLRTDEARRNFAVSLLSMAVPRTRTVILQPFTLGTNFSALIQFPTTLLPGLQFDELYNPATRFIQNIIREINPEDPAAVLGRASTPQAAVINTTCAVGACTAVTSLVCLAVPADRPMKVVVRDASTGTVLNATSTQSAAANQVAQVNTFFIAPGDAVAPTIVSSSWSPQSPHVLDANKPVVLQFSEPVRFGPAQAGQNYATFVDQLTGAHIPGAIKFDPDRRGVTITPVSPLQLGHAFLLDVPTLQDLAGNKLVGPVTFQMYQPTVINPTPSIRFTRAKLFADLAQRGAAVPAAQSGIGFKDLDFITLSPRESSDQKWHTYLFGVGMNRELGLAMTTLDATTPENIGGLSAQAGGVRFYSHIKALPNFGMRPRPLPNLLPDIQAEASRILYYDPADPANRMCDTGGRRASDWKSEQIAAGKTILQKSGCGDLVAFTSFNTYYSILHLFDVSDPAAPKFMTQRLLSDGGAIANFPRKKEAPAGNGFAKAFDILRGVDISHSMFDGQLSFDHQQTNAAYVAVNAVGLALIDLDLNVPDLGFQGQASGPSGSTGDVRAPQGTVIESEALYSFPYYQDTRVVGGYVVAVASDRQDGSGTAHLEVLSLDLSGPVGNPLPLPFSPIAMAVAENIMYADQSGTLQSHDLVFVSGSAGDLAGIAIKADGTPQLVNYISTPTKPAIFQGFTVSVPPDGSAAIEGSCPAIVFYVQSANALSGQATGGSSFFVATTAATRFYYGQCHDIVPGSNGSKVMVSGLPGTRFVNRMVNGVSVRTPIAVLVAEDIAILSQPDQAFVTALSHIEIDAASKLAYVGAKWRVNADQFQGILVVDIGTLGGTLIDSDNDGWDDRLLARIPITGPGQAIAAGDVNGFRYDPRRKLIYAGIDSYPKDQSETPLAVIQTCDCPELRATVELTSGNLGPTRSYPSLDGFSDTIFITPDAIGSGQVSFDFKVQLGQSSTVKYTITEQPLSGKAQDALLDLGNHRDTGTVTASSSRITLPLTTTTFDQLPIGSRVTIVFTDENGRFVRRATVALVTTRIIAPNVTVKTLVDKTNKKITEFPSYLNFILPWDAKVTVTIDGSVIQQDLGGGTAGAFADVPLPMGLSRVVVTRSMVSLPGEHEFVVSAKFNESGVATILRGTITHDIRIMEPLPIGHAIEKGVDLMDGHLTIARDDLSIPSIGPALQFARVYTSTGNHGSGPVGAGWTHTYYSRLSIDQTGTVALAGGDGGGMRFAAVGAAPGGGTLFKPQAGYHGSLVFVNNAYDYYSKTRIRYRYQPPPIGSVDGDYRLTSIEDPHGNRLELAYQDENLKTVTDAAGRSLSFTYAPFGTVPEPRIVRVDGPLGLQITYDYDSYGNLITATRDVRVEHYEYSTNQAVDRHNLQKVIDPNGNTTEYVYYASADSFPGESPEFQWGREILLIPQKFELVHRIKEGTGADLTTTTYGFDYSHAGKRVTVVDDARGTKKTNTMNLRGHLTETIIATPQGDNVTKFRWAYEDGIDDVNLVKKTDANGRVTTYKYDANGNMSEESIDLAGGPYGDASGVSVVTTKYEYDPKFSRLTKKTTAAGHITTTVLDPVSGDVMSVTTDPHSAPPITTHLTYADVAAGGTRLLKGVLKSIDDGLNHVTVYTDFDQYGNPTETTDAAGNTVTTTYDARGRVTETSDTFGRHTLMVYDPLDRVTSVKRFAGYQPQVTALASDDMVTTIEYFPGGQTRQRTDGTGHVTTFVLDTRGRVAARHENLTDADGTDVSFDVISEYDGNSNKIREIDGRGIEHTFEYDVLDRVKAATTAGATVTTITYDAVGNRIAETDIHGHVTTFTLDGLYRRVATTLPDPQYVERTDYDLAGNVTRRTDGNGFQTILTYDGIQRLLTETNAVGVTTTYSYDAANNVVKEVNTHGLSVERTFDSLNRPLVTTQKFIDPIAQGSSQNVVYTSTRNYLDGDHAVETTNGRGVAIRDQLNGLDQVVEKTVDPGGLQLTTTFRYDGNGNTIAIMDPQNGDTDQRISYDGLNRRIEVTQPLGGVQKFFHDGNNNLVRTVDRRGVRLDIAYDTLDRKIKETRTESLSSANGTVDVSRVAYDDAANAADTFDANGNATHSEFNALHQEILMRDPLGHETRNTWDATRRTSSVDGNGHRQNFTYDALNRMLSMADVASGTAVTTAYADAANRRVDTNRRGVQHVTQLDSLGRTRRVSRNHAALQVEYGSSEIVVEITEYDANGNKVAITNGNGVTTAMEYDRADRTTSSTEALGAPVESTTTYTYDRAGHMLTSTDPLKHTSIYSYDARYRRLTQQDASGATTTFTYDQADNVATMTEALGGSHVTSYTYDEENQPLTVDETRAAAGGVTTYTYDANRNLLTQADASGRSRSFKFDALNRMTDSFQNGSMHWRYGYDANANQTLVVDAAGQQARKTFDSLNRVVTKTYGQYAAGGSGLVAYPQPVTVTYRYDANGNITGVDELKQAAQAGTPVTETTSFDYDHLDRLVKKTNPDGKVIRAAFDKEGNRTVITDADGVQTGSTYDGLNRVNSTVVQSTGGTETTRFDYFLNGLPRLTTYPNGLISERSYDKANRLTQLSNRTASVTVSAFAYSYDVNGNRLTQDETRQRLTAGPERTTYAYDTLNRLASVSYGSAVLAYTYAPNGNRLTEVGTDPTTGAAVNRLYTYNGFNQLTTIVDGTVNTVVAYDANGNTIREATTGADPATARQRVFAYNILDDLVSVDAGSGAVSYDYDYNGRRVKAVTPFFNIRFLPFGDDVLQEYDAATLLTTTKYNYGDQLLSMVAGGTRANLYYSFDGLNSVADLTDESGGLLAGYKFDAWGNVRQSHDVTSNRRKFLSQYADTETGLNQLGARYYDGKTGLFLTHDSSQGNPQQPITQQRYLYGNANPLFYVDASGREGEAAHKPGEVVYDGKFTSWADGVFRGLGSPVTSIIGSAVKGLADIGIAGLGYLAMEATGGKYNDEIGAVMTPVSEIGKLSAEKGTWQAIKESARGFVKDSVIGIVTLPQRLIAASNSGDPEMLGQTLGEAMMVAQGARSLAKGLSKGLTGAADDVAAVGGETRAVGRAAGSGETASAIRARVMANVAENRAAMAASNFAEHVEIASQTRTVWRKMRLSDAQTADILRDGVIPSVARLNGIPDAVAEANHLRDAGAWRQRLDGGSRLEGLNPRTGQPYVIPKDYRAQTSGRDLMRHAHVSGTDGRTPGISFTTQRDFAEGWSGGQKPGVKNYLIRAEVPVNEGWKLKGGGDNGFIGEYEITYFHEVRPKSFGIYEVILDPTGNSMSMGTRYRRVGEFKR
jgi:RHS repeat-associated protein